MEQAINFFQSVGFLEPKCPKCKAKVEYGVTTKYCEKRKAHICNGCGCVIE